MRKLVQPSRRVINRLISILARLTSADNMICPGQSVTDAIKHVATYMKCQYDNRHKLMFFKVGDHVLQRLHRGFNMTEISGNTKLSQQYTGPFKVLGKNWQISSAIRTPASYEKRASCNQYSTFGIGYRPQRRSVSKTIFTRNNNKNEARRIIRHCE